MTGGEGVCNDYTQGPHTPSNVIARSPYFGRRGNLWCPETVRTGMRDPKREIASHHFVVLAMTGGKGFAMTGGEGARNDREGRP